MRWLLLPEDRRALDRLRPGEWPLFLETFWSRRGELAARFEARVAAADSLYGEPGTRGALTDRGRALILLGDPERLRVGELTVPAPRDRSGSRTTAVVPREVWIYQVERLAIPLADRFAEAGESRLRLVFLTEGGRTRLVEGHHLLSLAARAWVDSARELRPSGVVPPAASDDSSRSLEPDHPSGDRIP